MARGRKTGGRTAGTLNKATVVRNPRAKHEVQAAEEEGLLPLDVMLRVMRGDRTISDAAFQAAVAAAPFIHPREAAVSVTLEDPWRQLSVDELRLLVDQLARYAEVARRIEAAGLTVEEGLERLNALVAGDRPQLRLVG